jgi:outer membrane protein assembly factor BamA
MMATMTPPDTSSDIWEYPQESTEELVAQDYSMKLGVDFVGAGIAIDPEFGDVGNGGQLVLTDILGNHQFFFFFSNTSEGFEDFWKRVNAGVTYVNLSNRLNYSLSFFHFNTYSFDTFTDTRRERRFGGAVGARYPLNKFQRLEASLVGRQIERESEFASFGVGSRQSFTGSGFLSYVNDNTLWTIGGPLLGRRYYVTGGQTVDFLGRGFANTSLQIDLRQYLKLTSRSLIAARYLTRNTWGSDEQIWYLGGPWSLRGYDFREFRGRTIHLVNTEVRFPLIDGFALALPFGVIEMPMFRGALFFDLGQATRNKVDVFDTEWLGSFGIGTELNLGYAPVIRVNFTRTTDFDTISRDTGFELFIGFNY